MKNKTGFTLIELMIVLFIVGILAVASIPLLQSFLQEGRLKAAAETFSQFVKNAQSSALSNQQNVYLYVSTGSNWCYGANSGSTCNCSPNTCGLGAQSGSFYPSVTTTTSGFTANAITFDAVRAWPSAAAQVNFSVGSKTLSVIIGASGAVSFCSTGVAGYTAC